MNFKDETYRAIEGSGHTRDGVMFIGSKDGKYRITMDDFDKYSDFNYDNGFGSQGIAQDLIIYFQNKSYISRGEYDGSEWWEYNQPLHYSESDPHGTFTKLGGDEVMWESLAEINKS